VFVGDEEISTRRLAFCFQSEALTQVNMTGCLNYCSQNYTCEDCWWRYVFYYNN